MKTRWSMWLIICFFFSYHLQAQHLSERIEHLLTDTILTDSEVGLLVVDLDIDSTLFAYQANKLYRPASIQKVVTAITALEELGKEYTFETSLYHTGNITADSLLEGNLYVIGGFDPAFNSTDLQQMTEAVKAFGINQIKGSIIGNISIKDTLKWGEGWCWDDDMPILTPLLYEQKDSFLSMFYRNLNKEKIFIADSTFSFTANHPDSIITLIYRKQRTLEDLLPQMMKKSDNLYAEAVFYHLAALNGKLYAQAIDGQKQIRDIIKRICPTTSSNYRIADGSGVSLYNYLSPQLLIDLLRYAYSKPHIFQPLYKSMPISGIDGTLQHRMKKQSHAYKKVRAKTGTVTGVTSLAGYAKASNGHTLAFVIINQNVLHSKPIRQWQDRVCEELCR